MPNGMLSTWIENVKLSGVKNAMVVALDAHTKAKAEEEGLPAHEMHLTVRIPPNPFCTPKFSGTECLLQLQPYCWVQLAEYLITLRI